MTIRTAVCAALLTTLICSAQSANVPPAAETTFARLQYRMDHDESWSKGWYTDYPNMDRNLVSMLSRLSNTKVDTALITPDSDRIFGYPLVYAVEPEQITLNDVEATNIREYLYRGGFLLFDDFHGDAEFARVEAILKQIYGTPPTLLQLLPGGSELFSVFFGIDEVLQVLNDGIVLCAPACEQWEEGPSGIEPKVFAVQDTHGNIEVLLFFNTDLGDGLEWFGIPEYPQWMNVYATKMLTNSVIYAMTH